MKLWCKFMISFLTCFLNDIVWCQISMPTGCSKSFGGSLSDSVFSASSKNSSDFGASAGRINSTYAWIPKTFNMTKNSNPDYLQVDLGKVYTITAVQTAGYEDAFVNRFRIYFRDGMRQFFYRKPSGKMTLNAESAAATMNILCPTKARYVLFIPTSFHGYIALKVDIYGCEEEFKNDAIVDQLRASSVNGDRMTVAWTVGGHYDHLTVSYMKVNGTVPFDKKIGYETQREQSVVIRNLEFCTKYEITVTAEGSCSRSSKRIFAKTHPPAPSTPEHVTAVSLEPFTVRLDWKMPPSSASSCSSVVTGYRVNYKIYGSVHFNSKVLSSANVTHLLIRNLFPWKQYEFSIYATGQYGMSEKSNKVSVWIDGKAPSQPVSITELRANPPDSFTISWKKPPEETVNGQIKYFIVSFRKKLTPDWKIKLTYLDTAATIELLTAGTTYQVFVTLFNNKYNISTEIREIFVGRKAPEESAELTQNTVMSSPAPSKLSITWSIPKTLNDEKPEVMTIKVREMGEASWVQFNVSASRKDVLLDRFKHWRIYESLLTLTTSKGVYFTKTKRELVSGTADDKQDVVRINSGVSNEKSTVELNMSLPGQFVRHFAISGEIESSADDDNIKRTSFRTQYAYFKRRIENLTPWKYYKFQFSIKFYIQSKFIQFVSRPRTILVIGKSPGKAPSDVKVNVVNANSISVSWKPIPAEYIRGRLTGYSVMYSKSKDTIPTEKRTNSDDTSVLLTGLLSETLYFVQVGGISENDGVGPLSGVANATTLKDPQPPSHVKVDVSSETEIVVSWSHPIDKTQREANFTVTAESRTRGKVTKFYFHSKSDSELTTKMTYQTKMSDLLPETEYTVYVIACKMKDGKVKCSDRSNSVTVTTPKDPPPPTPTIITSRALSSTEIEVSWGSRVDLKNVIQNFTIKVTGKDGKTRSFYTVNHRSKQDMRTYREYSYSIKNLEPFTTYSIHIVANKKSGTTYLQSEPSNVKAVETLQAAPSAPLNLNVSDTGRDFVFSWKEPLKVNGIIMRYDFELYDAEKNELVLKRKVGSDDRKITVSNMLLPYRRYKALLKAFTVELGPAAEKVFTTPEGYPSAPRDVYGYFNGTHVVINWENPKEENGNILRYKIHLVRKELSKKDTTQNTYYASAKARKLVIKDKNYKSEFLIELAAETSKGPGPSAKIEVSLDPPKPEPPPQPEVKEDEIGATTMVVKLKPLIKMSYSLPISAYQVIVEMLNGGARKRRVASTIPEIISNHSMAMKNSVNFYVTAEFEAEHLPDIFVVGDGKTYNGYLNAPLNPETVYKVHMRAVVMDGNGNPIYGEPSSVRLPATAPRKSEKAKKGGVPLPIIAGIAGALLLLIILVAIIILYLRSGSIVRRRSKERKEPYDIELSKLRTQADPSLQRPVSLTGDYPLHPDHTPISFVNFSKHVAKMHRNDNSGFRAEYDQLEMGKEFSWDVAHQQENKPKNRFANIVAYDHARVILTRVNGNPGSDYINASYIDGYLKPNAYVATQGPLPGTFNDFWRMVWELRSSVVVMLTNLQEKNKLKCHKYWPDDCVEYGEIIVTLTRKEPYADYTIKTFVLEKTDSQESREVKHFHFTVWPDHGVPRYATAILAFRRRVRSYNNPDSGPTIVHCSAGVGRTGTYIALDAMLGRMNSQGDVDVFNFIAAMRTRRIAMVQTEEQYNFIHDAILESVQCGNTEITAQDLRIMINKLDVTSPETRMTGFEKEWKILNNVSPIPSKSSCNIAALPENMVKNRNQSACILPADNNLVRLLMIEDDEATMYINAVYVDGYKQRNAFILTQSPLKNTILDFWRMLCEHKSASVVLLSSLDEGEDFIKFWPEKHIREYEMITVECLSKEVGDNLTSLRSASRRGESELVVRQFRVEDSRNPEFPLMVKLFQYNGWTETKVPVNCNSIITLINQLERWQQQSGNGPVTVICSDGIGRSGTFAALNAVIERVKVEQAVDVFQAIKAMRIQRAHVVKTLDQYKFIYSAVEEYLNSFDDYANFK